MSRLQKKYQIYAEYRRNTLFSRLYVRFDLEIDDIIKHGLVDDDENNFDSKKVNDNFLNPYCIRIYNVRRNIQRTEKCF